ncbi:hypothetical protein, partial [Nocardia farcinica]|uniref:hypothetical protein n=1 Tax=Nocardia farcinica TaxID=37329 RepID=UPI002453FC07
ETGPHAGPMLFRAGIAGPEAVAGAGIPRATCLVAWTFDHDVHDPRRAPRTREAVAGPTAVRIDHGTITTPRRAGARPIPRPLLYPPQ